MSVNMTDGFRAKGQGEDIYVEILLRDQKAARGLDRGQCPLGMALKRAIDPDSVWVIDVDDGAVCRYRKDAEDLCYVLPGEAKEYLRAWDKWFISMKLAKARGKAIEPFKWRNQDGDAVDEFILPGHEYPQEHLVPDYLTHLAILEQNERLSGIKA